jgi:hypothetical protein
VIEGTVPAATLGSVAAGLVEEIGEVTDDVEFVADLDGCLQLVLLVSTVDRLRLSEARAAFQGASG